MISPPVPQRLLSAWALPVAFVIASVEVQRNWGTPLQWGHALVALVYAACWLAAMADRPWAWRWAPGAIHFGIVAMLAAGLVLLALGQVEPGQRALFSLLLWSPLICAWWAAHYCGQVWRAMTLAVAFYLATLPGAWPDQLSAYFQHAFQGLLLVVAVPMFLNALKTFRQNHTAFDSDAWMRDSETGVANRTYIEAELAHLAAMANRYPIPFSVVLVQLTETPETPALREAAWRIAERVRRPDTVCRWNENTFLVILPNTQGSAAESVAKELAQALGDFGAITTAATDHPSGGEALAAVGLAEQRLHRRHTGDMTPVRRPENRLPF